MTGFIRAALSFAWLEFKALQFYPINGLLQIIQSFVSVGIWFFVSLFLQEYATVRLEEYGGDFVAYMVVGVLFFQNTGTMMTLPFQSLSTAYWDKRLQVYQSRRFGIWAFIVGRAIWLFFYNLLILFAIMTAALYVAGVTVNNTIPILPAIAFYVLFILTCFGIGLIGASNFVFLEVKRGREPISWSVDVLARIFSGVYYPLAIIPASIRWVTWCLPHTYALQGIRQVMINGAGLNNTNTQRAFLILLAFCCASLVSGILLLNKALSKAERTTGLGIAT